MHTDWIIPDWPAPAGVHALCTTRAGGTSAAPYDSLNLGDHVGDRPESVMANRLLLQQALEQHSPGAHAVFLRQVHGAQCLPLDASSADGACADACVSNVPGRVCTIMVADCLPVLLTDTAGRAVAAAHAGWRGLAGGVIEETLESFRAAALFHQAQAAINGDANQLMAWLGPCIGPQAFEVGAEVREAFVATDAGAAACFTPHAVGKYLADLAGLARRRLAAAGVTRVYGNDGSADWCTVQQAARYFSYRRDQAPRGGTGRMAACIWLG